MDPQGTAPMQMQPDLVLGNYFNRQHRLTSQYQFVQTVTTHRTVGGQSHAFKADRSAACGYDGTSRSSTLPIERADATVARRLDFSGEMQSMVATEAAVFAQDRVQITHDGTSRPACASIDGVLRTVNLSPRIRTAVRRRQRQRRPARQVGMFVERTPSMAGAFTSFERGGHALSIDSLKSPVSVRESRRPSRRSADAAEPTWDAGSTTDGARGGRSISAR